MRAYAHAAKPRVDPANTTLRSVGARLSSATQDRHRGAALDAGRVVPLTAGEQTATPSSRVNFSGKSGQRYSFRAWPLGTKLGPIGGGIYLITARECHDRTFPTLAGHRCLAIGDAADLSGTMLKKAERDRLVARGANCICVYPVASEAIRREIKQDLIDGNEQWARALVHLVHATVPPRPPGDRAAHD